MAQATLALKANDKMTGWGVCLWQRPHQELGQEAPVYSGHGGGKVGGVLAGQEVPAHGAMAHEGDSETLWLGGRSTGGQSGTGGLAWPGPRSGSARHREGRQAQGGWVAHRWPLVGSPSGAAGSQLEQARWGLSPAPVQWGLWESCFP